MVNSGDRGAGLGTQQKGNPLPPPLGVIEVIHATLGSLTVARRKGVLTVVPMEGRSGIQPSEKRMKLAENLSFLMTTIWKEPFNHMMTR